MNRARALAGLVAVVAALFSAACQEKNPGPGPTASASAAPEPPPVDPDALYPASKPALAGAAALRSLPATTQAVAVAQSLSGLLGQLGLAGGDAAVRAAMLDALATEAREISKDLPDLADLPAAGVDPGRPCGVAWLDPELDVTAIFAAVADRDKLKALLDARAAKSDGRRVVEKVGDALVLRAKRDVTRAVVLRGDVAFWIRAEERSGADPERVKTAAQEIASVAEGASLAADAQLKGALDRLAFGKDAAVFARTGALVEHLIRGKRYHDREEALRELAKGAPALAAGVELGEREAKVKAFLAVADDAPIKPLSGAIATPPELLDREAPPRALFHATVDPRLVRILEKTPPLGTRYAKLEGLAEVMLDVDKEVLPLLTGEVAIALFDHAAPPASAAPAASAAPPASAPAPDKGGMPQGRTLVLGLRDGARMTALLDEALQRPGAAERISRGELRREPGSPVIEVASAGRLPRYLRVAGDRLVISTRREIAARFGEAPRPAPREPAPPLLAQLSRVASPAGLFTLDGDVVGAVETTNDLFDMRRHALRDIERFGILGMLGGSGTERGKKLMEERTKLRKEISELEDGLEGERDAAIRAVAPRFGQSALVARLVPGGVMLYGGQLVATKTLSELGDEAAKAWHASGPGSPTGQRIVALERKVKAIDDALDEEREAEFGKLFKSSLFGDSIDPGSSVDFGAGSGLGLGRRGGAEGTGPGLGGGAIGGLGTSGKGRPSGGTKKPDIP